MTRVANTTRLWHEDVWTNRITAWIRQGAYQRMVFRFNIIFMILSHWYNLGDPRTLISRPKNFEQTQYLTLGAGHISMGLQEAFRFLVSNFRGCSWITDVSGRAQISSIENEIGKNKHPLPRSNATNFYPKRIQFWSSDSVNFHAKLHELGISRNLTT